MKKIAYSCCLCLAMAAMSPAAQAQTLKDFLNKETLGQVVGALANQHRKVELTGTWTYQGSAVELKSDDPLMKLGGGAAATLTENKLNEQLGRLGIQAGQMNFTFNADSTFTTVIGKRTLQGTYSYNDSTREVDLRFLRLIPIHAQVKQQLESTELLFKSDKLLKLLAYIGNQSNSRALKTVGSLADKYNGMMLGFELKREGTAPVQDQTVPVQPNPEPATPEPTPAKRGQAILQQILKGGL